MSYNGECFLTFKPMTSVNRLKKNGKAFRMLTGITIEKFDEILEELKPIYEAWNLQRLLNRKRIRAPRSGNEFYLELEDRLLMLLMYYRTYVTHVFLGFLFRIDDSNISRNINPLQPLLAKIFKIPERRIVLSEDEIVDLFFDGTEQPINRPKKQQRKWYSGKKKRHTIKHQIAVVKVKKKTTRSRVRIKAVSKAFCGKTHDKEIYVQTRTTSPPKTFRYGDKGYQGTSLTIPHKKPKGALLSQAQKEWNHVHSSLRIVVEHGIGKMKIWKMASERYRNKRNHHTVMMKNIAGLQNLMFA